MNRSKRVAVLSIGVLLVGAGLGRVGPRVLRADEGMRQAGTTAICNQMQEPATVLCIIGQGKTVKKGDLLVELDAAPLTEKRMQQTLQVRQAEAEMATARQSKQSTQQTGQGEIELAERALKLAESRLKAYQEGEYPNQLVLAQATVALAKQKQLILRDQTMRLRAEVKDSNDPERWTAFQEAELAMKEAEVQATTAQNSLASLKTFIHDNKIAELELAVARKQFELTRAKTALADADTQRDIALSLADMRHAMESARLAWLDDQIAKSKVYAPQDGTVAYPNDSEPPIKPGTVVRPRQVLIRLLPAPPSEPRKSY